MLIRFIFDCNISNILSWYFNMFWLWVFKNDFECNVWISIFSDHSMMRQYELKHLLCFTIFKCNFLANWKIMLKFTGRLSIYVNLYSWWTNNAASLPFRTIKSKYFNINNLLFLETCKLRFFKSNIWTLLVQVLYFDLFDFIIKLISFMSWWYKRWFQGNWDVLIRWRWFYSSIERWCI